jgi:hypothetical protein
LLLFTIKTLESLRVFSGFGYGPVVGCCEHCFDPLSLEKGREVLDQLRNYQLTQEEHCSMNLFSYRLK